MTFHRRFNTAKLKHSFKPVEGASPKENYGSPVAWLVSFMIRLKASAAPLDHRHHFTSRRNGLILSSSPKFWHFESEK
jgi:hypothetical protein